MQRTAATLGATVIAALLSTGITVAETLSEDAIKYRHAVMDAMKGHISALSLMAFGKVNDPGFIDRHAVALASLGEELEHVFPAGSGDGETHALPIIWEEPERFAEALQAAKAATATLRDAVAGGNRQEIAKAFNATGDACKGCHERYREEHED